MAKSDTQIALRLPAELHEELRGSGNVSEEIRARLEAASGDPTTRGLQREIAAAAAVIEKHWVPWHEDADAYAVFRAAVIALLDQYQTKKRGARKSREAEILFNGPDAGERLALMVAWR